MSGVTINFALNRAKSQLLTANAVCSKLSSGSHNSHGGGISRAIR
jgi:hypothetical protein